MCLLIRQKVCESLANASNMNGRQLCMKQQNQWMFHNLQLHLACQYIKKCLFFGHSRIRKYLTSQTWSEWSLI